MIQTCLCKHLLITALIRRNLTLTESKHMYKPMAKISFLVVAVFMTCISYSQSNFSSELIGVGVVVSDLERSLDFYINEIGMVKAYSFTINEDFSKRSGLSNGVPTTV